MTLAYPSASIVPIRAPGTTSDPLPAGRANGTLSPISMPCPEIIVLGDKCGQPAQVGSGTDVLHIDRL